MVYVFFWPIHDTQCVLHISKRTDIITIIVVFCMHFFAVYLLLLLLSFEGLCSIGGPI